MFASSIERLGSAFAPAAPLAQAVASAPGRVCLLGEHNDYNDGCVLPVAIAQRTHVTMRRNGGANFSVHSEQLGRTACFGFDQGPRDHFATYVHGCLMLARSEGVSIPFMDITISSEVPMEVGLSSSAALEVATLRCLRQLLGLRLDELQLACMAQRAEIDFAHVHCGIMDQMASCFATHGQALLIDTRTLERRDVPLPEGSAVLVLDSGMSRALVSCAFNQRRAECETAALHLGKASLRDVTHMQDLAGLPAVPRRRARHILSEQARVLQAAHCRDGTAFGRLMNESHRSLRDDFEVSTPELDCLVSLLQAHPGVYGARLTGAGFGGACVALCRSGALDAIARDVLERYRAAGYAGRRLVPA